MNVKKKIRDFFRRVKTKVPKRYRWLLPFIYILILFLGLLLSLFYIKFPSLVVCSKLFGQEFCTPAGIYLILIISIPGYFIVGNLLPFLVGVGWLASFILVIFSSCLFYYFLGLAGERFQKASYSGKITGLVVSFFLVLLILALLLLL